MTAKLVPPRTVVVTGATAGVGRAVVRALGAESASVALVARGSERLSTAAAEVEAAGGRALPLSVDVADAAALDGAATQVEAELGPIDVWINNAMTSVFAPVSQLSAEEVARVTDVTYLGCVHGTLSALRRMRARDRGTIVQVGSALAYRSIPLQAAYCGAKHAVAGFTESLRCELLHDRSRVRVSSVHLPAINTPQFDWVRSRLPRRAQPVAPIFQPEVAAQAILWASVHAPRELKVTGSTIRAVYLQRLIPGVLDRYLAATGREAQQSAETADPKAGDNLFQALPGDPGAHGRFDAQAKTKSWQLAARLAPRNLLARLAQPGR